MNWGNVANAATIASGVIAVGGVIAWVSAKALKHWLAEQTKDMKNLNKEWTPNGGESSYDYVRKAVRAAERAADAAEETRDALEGISERVSNVEQTIVAWTPKKIAPRRKSTSTRE